MFPIEIIDIIYKYRAKYVLEDILKEQYGIKYINMCNFLIKHNAIIAGSLTYQCLDKQVEANDLDIYISNEEDCEKQKKRIFEFPSYRRKSELLFDDIIEYEHYTGRKYPMQNPLNPHEMNIGINYLVNYKLLNGKSIDLVYINGNVKDFLNKRPFSTISLLYFDGLSFHIPINDIDKLLTTKKIKLINPFDIERFKFYYGCCGYNIERLPCHVFKRLPEYINIKNKSKICNHLYITLQNIFPNEYNIDYIDDIDIINDDDDVDIDIDNMHITKNEVYKLICGYKLISGDENLKDLNKYYSFENYDDKNKTNIVSYFMIIWNRILMLIAKGFIIENIDEYVNKSSILSKW